MLVWGRGQFALGKKGQDIVWRPSLLVLALPLPCVTLSESLQLRSLLSWSVCGLERNFQTEGRMRRDAIRTVDWLKGDLTPFMASVQFSCSVVSDSLQPHESQKARPSCPSPTPRVYPNSRPSSRWWPSSQLILCHPLLLLPSILPSIRVFSNESTLRIKWPKHWSFSFSINLSNTILINTD